MSADDRRTNSEQWESTRQWEWVRMHERSTPGSCMTCGLRTARDTRAAGVEHRNERAPARARTSMRFSMRFLICAGCGSNRAPSWRTTSFTSAACPRCLRSFITRTTAASIWCRRSSSTRSRVSRASAAVSTRAATVAILIRCSGALKSALNENESPARTSRPGGCFRSTLYFAHASDCRCLCSSTSGIVVAARISCAAKRE
jgi:hypothetical protein